VANEKKCPNNKHTRDIKAASDFSAYFGIRHAIK
jgi:hypothetical protein